jgi:hypothetical protein
MDLARGIEFIGWALSFFRNPGLPKERPGDGRVDCRVPRGNRHWCVADSAVLLSLVQLAGQAMELG